MATFVWPAFAPPDATNDSQHLVDADRAKAREEGYAQGQQQALAEQSEVKATMAGALQELIAQRDSLATDYEAALTDLLFKALEALLRVELTSNPKVISSLVAEGLEVLNAKLEAVSVRANPEDLNWLQGVVDIEVVADESVPVGGLAVSVPEQCVEFDLVAKLRDLADIVDDEVDDEQQSGGHEPNPGNP